MSLAVITYLHECLLGQKKPQPSLSNDNKQFTANSFVTSPNSSQNDLFLLFLKDLIYLFREGKGERKRETSMCGCPS